jgi:hypothetical protein
MDHSFPLSAELLEVYSMPAGLFATSFEPTNLELEAPSFQDYPLAEPVRQP